MKKSKIITYIIAVFLIIALWEILALILNSPVLPTPADVIASCAKVMKTSEFWQHFSQSGIRVLISIIISLVIAFPLGILLGYNTRADSILSPILFLTYPIPKIVFLPVILVLFGLGNLSKIVLITLIISYQLLVIIRDGVSNIDKKHVQTIKSMGGTQLHTVLHVLVPAALPSCFTALRLSTGTAITVLFLAETYATRLGLGYYIMDSWGKAAYDKMFVGIIGMSILGIIFYAIFSLLEKKVCHWKMLERVKTVSEIEEGNRG
jgi:NitT/TauT family transport system permease protein